MLTGDKDSGYSASRPVWKAGEPPVVSENACVLRLLAG